jgi:hypothetical protein
VQLTRSSLCSILLADGEENLAVLIARADLPTADSQETAEVRRTLSDRWAYLVSVWTGTWNGARPHP